jgi:biotin operon repressor
MPKTKAYSDRRRILNELFRTKTYSLSALTSRVGEQLGTSISKKTIQDMIRYMREEGAPIKNIPRLGYSATIPGYGGIYYRQISQWIAWNSQA